MVHNTTHDASGRVVGVETEHTDLHWAIVKTRAATELADALRAAVDACENADRLFALDETAADAVAALYDTADGAPRFVDILRELARCADANRAMRARKVADAAALAGPPEVY